MAYNGSGTFSRLYDWTDDAAAAVKISSTRMDAEMDGMATGLSTAICKDGQTTPTANLPMGNFRHTGVGAASARTDYARTSQVQDDAFVYASAGGTADAITLSLSPAVTAYAAGLRVKTFASGANTGAVTLNVNGVGAAAVKKRGGTALAANDIPGAGYPLYFEHDGTDWELLNPVSVDLTSAQTVAGAKTFSATLTATGSVVGFPGRLTAVRTYTANDTWSKPSGLDFVIVEAVGGGGGGGGAATNSGALGSGGGGGGYSRKKVAAGSLGATETVTIGAAGSAGADTGGDGGTGGTTSFGAHVSVTGGTGGTGNTTANTATVGGNSGAGSGGDVNLTGVAGGCTVGDTGAAIAIHSGRGGASAFGYGSGGKERSVAGAGIDGSGYGGGGGGARRAGANVAGGAGTAGLVVVYEFTS